MPQTIIVIGLSAASMAFITKLRSFDKDSKIIAFSAEKDFPYNRCLLSDFLMGESELKDIQLKPKDFFEKNNIEVYFDTFVTKIDAHNNQIFVEQKNYKYDYLFLGIGTRPLLPAFTQNKNIRGIFTFHTLADMQKISNFIESNKPKSAVVIGAGLNGIEAAFSLSSKGILVALIEAQSFILPCQLDPQSAHWLENIVRNHGLMIIKGYNIVEICNDSGGFVKGVKFVHGTKIFCDMVIVATGSKLNHEILQNTNIILQNGSIVVNEHMQTNIQNILAGGDICIVPDIVSKKLTRSTTWSDAMLQGLCAATTLSTLPRVYPGIIGLRDSYFFGKEFYACGQTMGLDGFQKIIIKQTEKDLEVHFLHNGILKGFVLIGDITFLSELKRKYLS